MEGQTYTTAALEMGKWIAREWRWDMFATLDFALVSDIRKKKGARDVDRAMRSRLGSVDWSAVGISAAETQLSYWLERSVTSRAPHAYWWFAIEAHKFRTTPHFHGLIGGVRGAEWRDMWEDWYEGCGSGRLVPIRNNDAAAVYVAKYVNKGIGKVYTSPGLEDKSASAIERRAKEREVARINSVPREPKQLDIWAPRSVPSDGTT